MTLARYVLRSLRHYWHTHLAVVAGVAIAVSVLGGALVVGESVRASLRALALQRLGATDVAILGGSFFRAALADDMARQKAFVPGWRAACPLVVLEGQLEPETGGRRAGRVSVHGVDARFWAFHGLEGQVQPLGGRDVLSSAALAQELGLEAGNGVVLTLQQPSAIPAGVLQGERHAEARSVRLTVREVLPAARLGEFSLRPHQGAVRAIFVPMALLQRVLSLQGQANAILLARATGGGGGNDPQGDGTATRAIELVRAAARLEDLGLRLRPLEDRVMVSVESSSGFMPEPVEQAAILAARRVVPAPRVVPVLTYLANSIRVGDRVVPYSLVSALDVAAYPGFPDPDTSRAAPAAAPTGLAPIWLNAWAAGDLGARIGDEVAIDYYLWSDEGGLRSASARFAMAGVTPMHGAGGDGALTPDYPGLTTQTRMAEWDPPFPVDLTRVRPRDEAYWNQYRTAPKAFLRLEDGQRLWASRYGRLTSVRLAPPQGMSVAALSEGLRARLGETLDPLTSGALTVVPARQDNLRAAAGTTDFGEYFLYFSAFLVVAGLLLAGLFFRLGLEQRPREIGLLRAVGYEEREVARRFLAEGLVLAVAGSALGAAGAVGYAAVIVIGLRTWWSGAVGTTSLVLAPSGWALASGAAAGIVLAPIVVLLTLRQLVGTSPRTLLAGELPRGAGPFDRGKRALPGYASLPAAAGLLLIGLAAAGTIGRVPGFFGAGALLLVGCLMEFRRALRRPPARTIGGPGRWPVARLGARSSAHRPGRAILSVALIASATFVIVAVTAFRRSPPAVPQLRESGTGGYHLIGESLLPVHYDPGSPEGRRELGLGSGTSDGLSGVTVTRFRLRPGDDGSCLNLYRPTRPRVLGAPAAFIAQDRFAFARSLAATPEERDNPWRLLDRRFDDGAVPAIGDANSLAYVMHLKVADDFLLPRDGAPPVRLRIVAALSDSVLQSELVVAEDRFREVFPGHEGFRTFLVDAGAREPGDVAAALERGLAAYGLDLESTSARLDTFHRVENTYLSTFQALGALGLLLGTLGVGVVMLRNVLERKRELAVLRAVGFGPRSLSILVLAESLLLVGVGTGAGTGCALLAVAPALAERGTLPVLPLAGLVAAVFTTGSLSSLLAAATARRFPLVSSLRTE